MSSTAPIRYPEFVVADRRLPEDDVGPKYPKNINELIDRARTMNAPRPDGASPNPGRWTLMLREAKSGTLNDYQYTSVRDHALPLVRAVLSGVLAGRTSSMRSCIRPHRGGRR